MGLLKKFFEVKKYSIATSLNSDEILTALRGVTIDPDQFIGVLPLRKPKPKFIGRIWDKHFELIYKSRSKLIQVIGTFDFSKQPAKIAIEIKPHRSFKRYTLPYILFFSSICIFLSIRFPWAWTFFLPLIMLIAFSWLNVITKAIDDKEAVLKEFCELIGADNVVVQE